MKKAYKFKIGETVIVKMHKTDKRLWFEGKITDREIKGSGQQNYYQITGFGDPVQESSVFAKPKKKATPAQLAARENFKKMAKDGTLAKKRAAATKKGLNNSLPKGMTKSVAKAVKVTGLKKADGTLQKGFKYVKGGKIVKVKKK